MADGEGREAVPGGAVAAGIHKSDPEATLVWNMPDPYGIKTMDSLIEKLIEVTTGERVKRPEPAEANRTKAP